MDKGEVFQSYKRIRSDAEAARKIIVQMNLDPETRRALLAPIDHILHECRIAYTDLTGGPFHYDPVAVLSRKVAGGY